MPFYTDPDIVATEETDEGTVTTYCFSGTAEVEVAVYSASGIVNPGSLADAEAIARSGVNADDFNAARGMGHRASSKQSLFGGVDHTARIQQVFQRYDFSPIGAWFQDFEGYDDPVLQSAELELHMIGPGGETGELAVMPLPDPEAEPPDQFKDPATFPNPTKTFLTVERPPGEAFAEIIIDVVDLVDINGSIDWGFNLQRSRFAFSDGDAFDVQWTDNLRVCVTQLRRSEAAEVVSYGWGVRV